MLSVVDLSCFDHIFQYPIFHLAVFLARIFGSVFHVIFSALMASHLKHSLYLRGLTPQQSVVFLTSRKRFSKDPEPVSSRYFLIYILNHGFTFDLLSKHASSWNHAPPSPELPLHSSESSFPNPQRISHTRSRPRISRIPDRLVRPHVDYI